MAYCDRCGAYIPDGWTSCPACGYDSEQEAKQNQQAAAAKAHQAEQEKYDREEAEKRRAQRQAYDKVWAENEQRRRREEEEFRRRQQEQEERAREERRRREEEERSREESTGGVRVTVEPDGTKNVRVGDRVHVTVSPDGTRKVIVDNKEKFHVKSDVDLDFGKAGDKLRDFLNSEPVTRAEQTFSTAGDKLLPLLSYLGPLCFIPLILGQNDFTKFHARQGLRLVIWSAILGAVGSMFGIGWAFTIFQVLMSIIGVKNVLNGEEKKLPYIGG